MPKISYEIPENKPMSLSEPAVAYNAHVYEKSVSHRWDPNVPFVGTQ